MLSGNENGDTRERVYDMLPWQHLNKPTTGMLFFPRVSYAAAENVTILEGVRGRVKNPSVSGSFMRFGKI